MQRATFFCETKPTCNDQTSSDIVKKVEMATISAFYVERTGTRPFEQLTTNTIVEWIKSGDQQLTNTPTTSELAKSPYAYLLKLGYKVAVTWGANFKLHRHINYINKINGFMCFGFHKLTPERIKSLLSDLSNDPFSCVVFAYPLDSGIKVVVQIDCKSVREYELFFLRLSNYYEQTYRVTEAEIDKESNRIDQSCYLPYDPDVYYNSESKQFTLSDNDLNKSPKQDICQKETVEFNLVDLEGQNISSEYGDKQHSGQTVDDELNLLYNDTIEVNSAQCSNDQLLANELKSGVVESTGISNINKNQINQHIEASALKQKDSESNDAIGNVILTTNSSLFDIEDKAFESVESILKLGEWVILDFFSKNHKNGSVVKQDQIQNGQRVVRKAIPTIDIRIKPDEHDLNLFVMSFSEIRAGNKKELLTIEVNRETKALVLCDKKANKPTPNRKGRKANSRPIDENLVQLLSAGEMARGKVCEQLEVLAKRSDKTIRVRINKLLATRQSLKDKDGKLFQLVQEELTNVRMLHLEAIT